MSVVDKFSAFIGSLSPAEQGQVMPLMISFMQGNQGVGMTGPSMGADLPVAPPSEADPGAPPPPSAAPSGPAPLPPPVPGLQPGGLMGRPPLPPTQIGNKAY